MRMLLFDRYLSMRDCVCCGRFLPVAVFAIAWPSRKVRLGNASVKHGESTSVDTWRKESNVDLQRWPRCIHGRNDGGAGQQSIIAQILMI